MDFFPKVTRKSFFGKTKKTLHSFSFLSILVLVGLLQHHAAGLLISLTTEQTVPKQFFVFFNGQSLSPPRALQHTCSCFYLS